MRKAAAAEYIVVGVSERIASQSGDKAENDEICR